MTDPRYLSVLLSLMVQFSLWMSFCFSPIHIYSVSKCVIILFLSIFFFASSIVSFICHSVLTKIILSSHVMSCNMILVAYVSLFLNIYDSIVVFITFLLFSLYALTPRCRSLTNLSTALFKTVWIQFLTLDVVLPACSLTLPWQCPCLANSNCWKSPPGKIVSSWRIPVLAEIVYVHVTSFIATWMNASFRYCVFLFDPFYSLNIFISFFYICFTAFIHFSRLF